MRVRSLSLALAALLAFSAPTVWAQDEETATDGAAADGAGETEETPAEEQQEEEEQPLVHGEPEGVPTEPFQYIIDQGTTSWVGFSEIFDDQGLTIGKMVGQTGWTGINEDGDKIMSFQTAFVIKANNGASLRDIFQVAEGEGSQGDLLILSFPNRGQTPPAEDWQMLILELFMPSSGNALVIEAYQTLRPYIYNDMKKGDSWDDIRGTDDLKRQIYRWTFDSQGNFASAENTLDTNNGPYWVPVAELTTVSEDQLVLVIEGNATNINLPDIRGGSSLVTKEAIIDSRPGNVKVVQAIQDITMTWSENQNRCTLPADCPDFTEEDSAQVLVASSAALLAAFTSLALF